MRPIHPGEVLREEFLLPMGVSAHALAMALHVPAPRINDIARERRAVTADTAMRLARYFGTSAEFWLGLQSDYEMARARCARRRARGNQALPRCSVRAGRGRAGGPGGIELRGRGRHGRLLLGVDPRFSDHSCKHATGQSAPRKLGFWFTLGPLNYTKSEQI